MQSEVCIVQYALCICNLYSAICIVQCMQCNAYYSLCAIYTEQLAMVNLQCAIGNWQWAMGNGGCVSCHIQCVLYAMCNLHEILCILHLCNVQVHFTMYTWKCMGSSWSENILDIYQLLSFEFSHFCNLRKNIKMMNHWWCW